MIIGAINLRNNKGQALVEFVIILPVTLLLIFSIIDFGRVISLKNDLESKTDDAITFYKAGKTLDEINNVMDNKDIKLNITTNDDYTTIKMSKKIEPITPGLSYILKKVLDVEVYRVIKNE